MDPTDPNLYMCEITLDWLYRGIIVEITDRRIKFDIPKRTAPGSKFVRRFMGLQDPYTGKHTDLILHVVMPTPRCNYTVRNQVDIVIHNVDVPLVHAVTGQGFVTVELPGKSKEQLAITKPVFDCVPPYELCAGPGLGLIDIDETRGITATTATNVGDVYIACRVTLPPMTIDQKSQFTAFMATL